MGKNFLKKKVLFLILGFSLIGNLFLGIKTLFPEFPSGISSRGQEQVSVVRIVDGDTFMTEDNQYVRLAGIDAPEYPNQCLSLKAKERLEELIGGKTVKIEMIKTDKFNRIFAFIFLDKVLIDRVLLSEGLGKISNVKSDYYPQLLQAETEAQKLAKGIHSSLCQPPENCLIKGNIRRDKGTKIYHLPECYNYKKIVINEREGDKWFCSEEAAEAAGFVKSADCPK